MAGTLVFTATYNEAGNIEKFCQLVTGLDKDLHLLVVDDNSPDGTGDILDKIVAKSKNVHVIHREGKLGLGSAHKAAFKYARENDYSTLITMDADFSHNPEDIPRFIEAIQHTDFVIGSRFIDNGSSDYTGYRKFVSSLGNAVFRFFLGLSVHEFTNSFRAFNRNLLESLDLEQVQSEGYSFFMEMVFRISFHKFTSSEIPIHFSDRESGESKIPQLQLVYSVLTLVRLICIKYTAWFRKR